MIFEIADLSANDLKNAARMNVLDYKDAIQMTVADRIKTILLPHEIGDMRDFVSCKVPAVKLSELLERL